MKKSNFLLSALLVPALVLQGQTCASGTALALPTTVTGLQTFNPVDSSYSFTMTRISPSTNTTFATGTPYAVYCTNNSAPLSGVSTTYRPYSYSGSNGYPGYSTVSSNQLNQYAFDNFGSTAVSGLFNYDAATSQFDLTLSIAQEWNAVNWILNNPSGINGDVTPNVKDTQAAIWALLDVDGNNYFVNSPASPANALQLYKDALANDTVAPSGPLMAVLMVPVDASGNFLNNQGFIIPVKTPCTSTGSATITKTANVTCANAFQIVTFKYVVKNTGQTTLSNLVVVDDNGTPGYSEDDVTVGTLATLLPNASYTFTSTAYLPISLFYQSGTSASFDTLIPQAIAATSQHTMGSLLLTYLIDSDVSDNTYGTGASAGWAGNGGHTFLELTQNYAEFALFDSKGHTVSDFNADYLGAITPLSTFPSGYGSTGVLGKPAVGGTTYLEYITTTLADNLNGYSKFYKDTTNSPTPVSSDVNWQNTSGYKVIVDNGIFGWYGLGSVAIKKDYLSATETGFSGKCGSPRPATYAPTFVASKVTSSAYLCATVCGCTTVVHAKACLTVCLNGCSQPTCVSAPAHKCLTPTCGCTCASCKAGHCNQCTDYGCPDSTCQKNSCPHGQVKCVVASVPKTICW